MDLGFSRRERNRDARGSDADRLRSLLAEIAIRQAMTATALMQSGSDTGSGATQGSAAIAHFAPQPGSARAFAFHADVAAAIVNDRQDS